MTELPAPDHRDRLVWSSSYSAIDDWYCACGQFFSLEAVTLRHAAHCPVVANRMNQAAS